MDAAGLVAARDRQVARARGPRRQNDGVGGVEEVLGVDRRDQRGGDSAGDGAAAADVGAGDKGDSLVVRGGK